MIKCRDEESGGAMITLTGKKIAEGIAVGKLAFYSRGEREIRRICVEDTEKELLRFQKAREKADQELREICLMSEKELGEANAMIFEMQQMILADEEFVNGVTKIICGQRWNAEYAVQEAAESFVDLFSSRDTSYIRGHEADVRDVAFRLVRILARSRKDRRLMGEPFIMAARDLYPSEALQLDKSKVLGFVTMYGSINSHTAALARTRGIPSVIGIGDALKKDYDGKTVIIDGFDGKLYIEPDHSTMKRMLQKKKQNVRRAEVLERLKGKENVTQSGQKIDVCANIGAREDIESVLSNDANGIGLFRSEFLYMENGGKLPTEDQQFRVYRMAAEAMGMKRVVIRAADIGGDKQAECVRIPSEANPMMGYRGIRILLDKEEMFRTQLRAVLRASAFGNLAIMFPMITAVEEVTAAKKILEKVKEELRSEKIAFDHKIEIGVMIETPAAVMLSGELAREVDFFSIGTNDLTQYTLAMDRQNLRLSGYYNPHHPALIKMIRIVANNVHLEGKRIGICGDLAADVSLTEMFLKMGIDELSVAPSQILPLRKKIREIR